jgi:transcriptional regulator with XRE-family HTH domain
MLLSRVVFYRYSELIPHPELPRREMASTFGTRIKELRNKQKLTLEQLAQASGSAKSYIWELENKNPPRPSADKLSLIAQTLGVTVDYLFGRDEQTLSSAEDIAFFREYTGLPDDTKEQLRQMAKILGTKKDT